MDSANLRGEVDSATKSARATVLLNPSSIGSSLTAWLNRGLLQADTVVTQELFFDSRSIMPCSWDRTL